MLGKYLIGHAISCDNRIILAHDLSRVAAIRIAQWRNFPLLSNDIPNKFSKKKSLPHQTVATDWNWIKKPKNLVQLRLID